MPPPCPVSAGQVGHTLCKPIAPDVACWECLNDTQDGRHRTRPLARALSHTSAQPEIAELYKSLIGPPPFLNFLRGH